jgi:hypothetical protein
MLLDAVKPYCLRWRDILFILPLSAHCRLNTSTFPCLERLALYAFSSDTRRHPVIIRDAPLLREATISVIPSLQVNFPMELLTILDFTDMRIPQIIAVLRWCPNLVDLTCSLTGRGDGGAAPPLVELHALRSLDISNEEFLVYVTAPCLQRLQIRRMISVPATTTALHAMVSRSSCALKFLAVRLSGVSGPVPAAQIQDLFRAANTVEHLQLCIISSGAPLVEALHNVDVLPHLRRLEVHDEDAMKGDRQRSLVDLLTWRRTHAALQSFELVVSTATIMAEFRALGEAKLHVRVTTRKRDSTSTD